jgi:putative serine protease PepD
MNDLDSRWSLPAVPPTEPPPAVSPDGDTAEWAAATAAEPDTEPVAPVLPSEPPTAPWPLPPQEATDAVGGSGTLFPPIPPIPPLPPKNSPPTTPPVGGEPVDVRGAPPRLLRRLPRGVVSALAVAAIALAAGGVGGAIGVRTADNSNGNGAAGTSGSNAATGNASGTPIIPSVSIPTTGLSVREILTKVEPAVVDIQARGTRGVGQGTGVVVNAAQGLIVTNAHVVEGGGTITVTASTDKQARTATVVGTDSNSSDIALLKVDNVASLVQADLGSSAATQVGDDVVAIGNALGLRGDPSVTRGIVSGLGRTVGNLTGMMQTDAAINPGNSGGPLVNAGGQVIGINTAVAGSAQNIGFAIPIDAVRTIVERIAGGQPVTPVAFLGVASTDATDGSPGAVIAEVTADSPASKAGLQVGDRILSIDGTSVPGAAELRGIIQAHKPGDSVRVVVVRNGDEQTVTVQLTGRTS